MKRNKKNLSFNFETAIKELETVVASMEQGNLSLEDSLKLFERGISLTRECQLELKSAEQKVQILLEKSATAPLKPFHDIKDEKNNEHENLDEQ